MARETPKVFVPLSLPFPMSLTPEQKQSVSGWVAAGDNLSTVQKKLLEQFKVSMTYMDVRFLVDDLNLALKDPAPKVDASDVSKTAAKAPTAAPAKPNSDAAANPTDDGEAGLPPEELEADLPPSGGAVTVEVDAVTLMPGAMASGTVTFSDGVTGKWIVDNYGRPGFTEISQPGYRPSPADGQAFMQELSAALQQKGF
ncbi:hypothetical protein MASR2M8_10370 [Opitutaceae bacterium]